jgi:ParB-like chromosome segregation protein Spo0J
MLAKGQEAPILVRPDGQRFVLVEGLHRLEACKALGEATVPAYLAQARKH